MGVQYCSLDKKLNEESKHRYVGIWREQIELLEDIFYCLFETGNIHVMEKLKRLLKEITQFTAHLLSYLISSVPNRIRH